MSLERGKFGIEWNPRQDERKPSGLKWVFLVVGLVALASLSVTVVKRVRRARAESAAGGDPSSAGRVEEVAGREAAPGRVEASRPPPTPPPPVVKTAEAEKRPPRVRNLLLRLGEAEKKRDIEMAASTIEQIRALPGSPAADLDDPLARRLGTLNMKRLFVKRTPLWVREATVRRGDSATRIAAENGSTFASLVRLNGGDVEKIRVGQKLYVMDHPRFTLVVHRRARTADLLLKDRFFKRYDVLESRPGQDGSHELPRGTANFLKSLGVRFKTPDATELELLMPIGSTILISEL